MKYLEKFLKDRRAVTPVVGVILMVAVTVVMGAVIAGFVYGYVGSTEQGPLLGISVEDDPTGAISLLLKHTGGEPVDGGDWKFSVTANKDSSTVFEFASTLSDVGVIQATSGDITAGKTFVVGHETDGIADTETTAPTEDVGTGDGVTFTFTDTLLNIPVKLGTVEVEVAGDGTLTDAVVPGTLTGTLGSGTIDAGGALSMTFDTEPANAAAITADYDYTAAVGINKTGTNAGWYHVVVIHEPSNSLLMDTNVQVR